jgi:hypothetical protein
MASMPTVILLDKLGQENAVSTPTGFVNAVYNYGWRPKTGTVEDNFNALLPSGVPPVESMFDPVTLADLQNPTSPAGASLRAALGLPVLPGVLVAAGDSIPFAGDNPTAGNYSDSYNLFAALLSGGALEFRANTSIGGRTSTQILAGFDTEVAPLKPSIVTFNGFTNDLYNGVSDAQYRANVIAYVAKCRSSGALPVPVSPFPINSQDALARQRITENRAWLIRYCASAGIPCLDALLDAMNPATADYVADYGGTDGTHPGSLTHLRLGQRLWNLLSSRYPLPPVRRYAAWNSDPGNLLSNGLFQNGTTIATGWGQSWGPDTGTVAFSVATDAAAPGGKVQRMAFTGATGHASLQQDISTGWAIGDVLELSAEVSNPAGSQAYINFRGVGGTPNPYVMWNQPITRASVVRRITVPTGTTAVRVILNGGQASGAGALTGNVDFAGLTVRNLTTLGLA